MEYHIQKCQHCGSCNLRNILQRDEQQKVFAQCRDCGRMVARYILASGGYYHAGKGFESFLRSIEREGAFSSGRGVEELFEEMEAQSSAEFNELLAKLKQRYKQGLP